MTVDNDNVTQQIYYTEQNTRRQVGERDGWTCYLAIAREDP